MEVKSGKKHRDGNRAIIVAAAVIVLLLLYGWKLPVILKLESLNLPAGYETIYPSKVHISDVYWLHIKGEKVIRCDWDYEKVEEYVRANNSPSKLKNIKILPYGGMSDIAIYDAAFDETFWQQADRDCYVTISYLKKI